MRNRIHTAKPAPMRKTLYWHIMVERHCPPDRFLALIPTFSKRAINSMFRHCDPYRELRPKVEQAIRKVRRSNSKLQGLEYFAALEITLKNLGA